MVTLDADLDDCQRKNLILEPDEWGKYQIQRGDTFSQLANIYNISIEDLMKVNCYEKDLLYAKDYLLVPITE